MANYYIYCLHTLKTVKECTTITEAYKELKHIGGYGIANGTTNLPILRRTINGFTLPKRLSEKYPKIERKLINKCHLFY